MHLQRVAALLSILQFGALVSGAAHPACRCTFGDPCWPSQADFDGLASKLSQPLLRPLPPASICYPSGDPSACAEAKAHWDEGLWRADQPGAMQDATLERFFFPNGTIEACYLDTSLTNKCSQGNIPVVGVDARTVEDVQAGVNFAREHNLRLVVKSTGHDYLSRSTARGSFMIWTHNLKDIKVQDAFRPQGAPENETYPGITIGGGDQWHDVYEQAHAAGRSVAGGLAPGGSVGAAGGWPAGGGHSMLSPTYGLGVDNILEMSVVTADGKFLVANAHQNTDLFWALRGGGGGTFGVVTGLTYRTHPVTPFIFAEFSVQSTDVTPAFRQIVADVVSAFPNQSDAGWGGYADITGTAFTFLFGNPRASLAEGKARFGAFFARAHALADASNGTLTIAQEDVREYPSWLAWYRESFGEDRGAAVETAIEGGSWLLPRTLVESDVERVVATAIPLQVQFYAIAGGAVSKVDPEAMGLNPAWRKTIAHTLTGTTYPINATAEEVETQRQQMREMMTLLRALAPESGSYLNEASQFEPDPAHAFFGAHYAKLKEIKAKYDSEDVFVVAQGVGYENWDASMNCRVAS